jgi:hypothetical protein
MQLQPGMSVGKEKTELVEKFWRKLEEQTEEVLNTHSAEVHAVAQALLDRNDLTGKQCIEIIRMAATSDQVMDSELLLKSLVEETIVNGNGSNGKKAEEVMEEKPKPKKKLAAKAKAKAG